VTILGAVADTRPIDPALIPGDWRDIVSLTKPRVLTLVVFTGLCGLLAAPGHMHPILAFAAILAITLGAGGAGALNQWHEAERDGLMKRTAGRPLPSGRLQPEAALHFGVGLSVFSVGLMGLAANWAAAAILAVSILFYVLVYTVWLKPRTPQNIVIGGAAGAFPPLIGWVAATGSVDLLPILLFALIFFWTPPHFWSLSLFVRMDYANAGIPMMPVVAGEVATRRQILIYTGVMGAAALAPIMLGLTGMVYGVTAAIGTAIFAALSLHVAVRRESDPALMVPERRLFKFSLLYLALLFAAVPVDHWIAMS
jgi:protoheme IX farnesyltransferase